MTEWTKGNKPYSQGLYWVTVNEAGKIKMYDEPMCYKDGIWQLGGKNYPSVGLYSTIWGTDLLYGYRQGMDYLINDNRNRV